MMVGVRAVLLNVLGITPLLVACMRGADLVPPEAADGVTIMIADGAAVTGFVEGPPSYDIPSGVVSVPDWPERPFLVLHEVCHAWQNRHAEGDRWIALSPAGQQAASLGMTAEDAADACALHYLHTDVIPVPPDRREPGYAVGQLPAGWMRWAEEWMP